MVKKKILSDPIPKVHESIPVILSPDCTDAYALLDSGHGRKLEQYGAYHIVRPEPQAFWRPSLEERFWHNIDAEFTGNPDEEGCGRWRFPKKPLGETWPLSWNGLDFYGRFTSFRHVGVFPEQAAHWQFIEENLHAIASPIRLLNLFAYTGIASLVAARAGAQVTHVDASKRAMDWAKENQIFSNLSGTPIRWICDDVTKFCAREVRRKKHYDAILLDPPKYGRGPKGEVWQLFDHLPQLLELCATLLSPRAKFLVLTSYSIRSSCYGLHELMQDILGSRKGTIESGELVLNHKKSARKLSTSLFSRWIC